MTPLLPPSKEFPLYALILVDINTRKIDKPFTYGIPEEFASRVAIGSTVVVNFNNQKLQGYVIDLKEFPPPLPRGIQIKPIEDAPDPQTLWDREMIELARWMVHYYGCTFLDAVKVLVPSPVRAKEDGKIPEEPTVKMVVLKNEPEDMEKLEKKAKAQAKAIKYILEMKEPVKLSDAVKESGAARQAFQALEKKDYIEIFEGSPSFQFFHKSPSTPTNDLNMTQEQEKAFFQLMDKYRSDQAEVALLHGITGSGKTEVYLQVIREVLKEGREALVLVPEISLTPQAIQRFRGRFGEDMAVLHSRLTDVERRQMWWKIRHKQVRVVVGARSAIFAPLENLGVIVVDEEHDSSYKQDKEPRYNARQIAIKRAMMHKSLVILGSATPSMEAYHYAMTGKYSLLELPSRVGDSVLPAVEIIDLKEDFAEKKSGILGDTLKREMLEVIERGEQVMLFLNRRGYSAFILCPECGNVIRCPYCDITLTYHRVGLMMKCHYCDYERPAPTVCPFCKGKKLATPAHGIQEVEEEIEKYFPGVSYIRMDKDTTRDRDSHQRILSHFADRKSSILLGTQMIAKGHDFPGVTLVGVVYADIALYLPDFRSLERAYQILVQVSGRAGRRDIQGKVIIQTYNPETPVIQAVARQNYMEFYNWETGNRRPLNYPPFAHIINLLFSGKNEEQLRNCAIEFAGLLGNRKFRNEIFLAVLGPAPCPLSRIKNRYRWHITLKGQNVFKMVAVVKKVKEMTGIPSDISFFIDVDPMSLM